MWCLTNWLHFWDEFEAVHTVHAHVREMHSLTRCFTLYVQNALLEEPEWLINTFVYSCITASYSCVGFFVGTSHKENQTPLYWATMILWWIKQPKRGKKRLPFKVTIILYFLVYQFGITFNIKSLSFKTIDGLLVERIHCGETLLLYEQDKPWCSFQKHLYFCYLVG